MRRILKSLAILSLALGASGCITWYESIEANDDGTYTLIRNERKGLFVGGPKAQVWVGSYTPATNTMTITRKSEKGL